MKSLRISRREAAILGVFALVMLATRGSHFGTRFSLPDASFAIFFLAGFYLRRAGFFLLLAAETVLIDYTAITYFGVSNWCWTPAYAALVFSYLVLWGGGHLAYRAPASPLFAARALTTLAVTSAAYLISDAAFYWLSGRHPDANWTGYWLHMSKYFVSYVGITCGYIGVVALAHFAATTVSRPRATG